MMMMIIIIIFSLMNLLSKLVDIYVINLLKYSYDNVYTKLIRKFTKCRVNAQTLVTQAGKKCWKSDWISNYPGEKHPLQSSSTLEFIPFIIITLN